MAITVNDVTETINIQVNESVQYLSTINELVIDVVEDEIVIINSKSPILMVRLEDPTDTENDVPGVISFPKFTVSDDGKSAYLFFNYDIPQAKFKVLTEGVTAAFTNAPDQTVDIIEDEQVIINSAKSIFLVQLIDPTDGNKRSYPKFTLTKNGLTAVFTIGYSIGNAQIKLITE